MSELIAKVVPRGIEHHLPVNYLHDRYQSAYRKDHSTKTALITLHSDISDSVEDGSMRVLVCWIYPQNVMQYGSLHIHQTFEQEAYSWMKSYYIERF